MRSAGLASIFMVMQLAIPVGIAVAADAAAPGSAAMQPAVPVAAPASAANPQPPVPAMPAAPAVVGHADAGRRIYSAICVYCHHLDDAVSDVGAPGLKGAIKRHDAAWIGHWLADPQGFAESDATAKALIAANPYGLVMPAFPTMQDAQNRADIIAFLQTLGESQPAQ